jgi:hypothetical protein
MAVEIDIPVQEESSFGILICTPSSIFVPSGLPIFWMVPATFSTGHFLSDAFPQLYANHL